MTELVPWTHQSEHDLQDFTFLGHVIVSFLLFIGLLKRTEPTNLSALMSQLSDATRFLKSKSLRLPSSKTASTLFVPLGEVLLVQESPNQESIPHGFVPWPVIPFNIMYDPSPKE